MLTTRFTELVGCAAPIQQAGMGPIASPELAAAVSEAGGLGMLCAGAYGINAEILADLLAAMQQQTARPFGVNFVASPRFQQRRAFWLPLVEEAARVARVVEFFWDSPDAELVALAHRGGALVDWQVVSREEAVAAAEAGCNFIVAQGIEAGGHVRGRIGLLPLLAEVLDAVSLPVLAAGGIATGRGLAAVLAAGAEGVRIGTRFVASAEANAHPEYVERLLGARGEDTVYTNAFNIGWPDAPHRVLRSALEAAESFSGEVVGEMIGLNGVPVRIRRFGTG